MVKVLISDNLSPRAADIFRDRGIDVEVDTKLTPEQLLDRIGDYEGLAVRSATKATAAVLAAAGNLKVIGRAGIGVDNIDVAAATQNGVVVMNTPFGNAITTAEHAIAMMLAVARQIPAANQSTQAGKWEKSAFMGAELTGKRLGLIGCGNIGSIVADRAQGLKMKVMAFDPFLTENRAQELNVAKVELEQLFAEADFITLHTPLTDSTRGIIDANALNKMKPGVRIVNCARGGLIDEDALRVALDSGHVAGAAIDVFAVEPAQENILFGAANLVATPHLGAATMEAQEKVALQVAEQMADYLLTGAVTNAINMASVSAEEAPVLKPYMQLGELLGSFLGQVTRTGIKSVTLEFSGQAAGLNTDPVTAATLAGLLRPSTDTVNMVNAVSTAHDRGITVNVVRTDRPTDYNTGLSVSIDLGDRSRTVSGTLIGGNKPRLVDVQGISVEAEFGAHMLYIRNWDKPGFIGALGSLLGESGVNIATFHLGRSARGEEAIALVEIDDAVGEKLLGEVRDLPHVVRADALHFAC